MVSRMTSHYAEWGRLHQGHTSRQDGKSGRTLAAQLCITICSAFDIHHPTDNTLLWDVVRVVTRLVGRLGKLLELRRIKGFRDRTRSARRRMYEIQRMTTRQRHEEQTGTYRELIGIAEKVVERARMVLEKTSKARGKDMLADMAIEEIRKDIEHYCGLGSHVIDQ